MQRSWRGLMVPTGWRVREGGGAIGADAMVLRDQNCTGTASGPAVAFMALSMGTRGRRVLGSRGHFSTATLRLF